MWVHRECKRSDRWVHRECKRSDRRLHGECEGLFWEEGGLMVCSCACDRTTECARMIAFADSSCDLRSWQLQRAYVQCQSPSGKPFDECLSPHAPSSQSMYNGYPLPFISWNQPVTSSCLHILYHIVHPLFSPHLSTHPPTPHLAHLAQFNSSLLFSALPHFLLFFSSHASFSWRKYITRLNSQIGPTMLRWTSRPSFDYKGEFIVSYGRHRAR